jgi:hypothetical protein
MHTLGEEFQGLCCDELEILEKREEKKSSGEFPAIIKGRNSLSRP